MVVAFVGVVFAVGATITSLARLGDDELGVSAGDWLLGAGAALGAAGCRRVDRCRTRRGPSAPATVGPV